MADATPGSPGWFPDPDVRHQLRWWDGVAWTSRVADNGVESDDPVRSGPPLAPAAPPAPPSPYGQAPGTYAPGPPTAGQPFPTAYSAPPIVPGVPGVAGAKKSRTPMIIGLGVIAVAVLVVAALVLADGGGGASGAGDFAGEVNSRDGGIVERRVSVPANSVLIVEVEPDSSFDVAVSVLGDDDDADAIESFVEDLANVDPESIDLDDSVAIALTRFVTSSSGDSDELADDNVDESNLDDLPPALLLIEDPGSSGDNELLVLATNVALDDLVVAFTGFGGDEGAFEAIVTIVELDVDDDDDAETFIDACIDNDELQEILG